MSKIKLDRIDRQILHDLQEDGRMSNVAIAEKAGISAPPCLRRIRAMEDAGYIKGYHAILDAHALDYPVTVFANVGLASHADKDLKKFEEMVNGCERIRESYMMTGDTDFMLKIVAKSWDDYQEFLTKELTAVPNVHHVKSSLAIRSTKCKVGVPVEIKNKVVETKRKTGKSK